MYHLIVFSIILTYLIKNGLTERSATQMPCLNSFNPFPTVEPSTSYIPNYASTSNDTLVGGQIQYCDLIYDFLSTELNPTTPTLGKAFTLTALSIQIKFYLCEPSNELFTSLSPQFGATYNAGLRRIHISSALLLGDRRKLIESLRHELFHAACHAMQLAKKGNSTHNRQAFIDKNQKSQIENFLELGKMRLANFLNSKIPNTKEIKQLRKQVVALEKNYTYPDFYKKNMDPLVRAGENALHIIAMDERVPKYRPDEQLSERLAYFLSEVPDPIIEYFFNEFYQHSINFTSTIQNPSVYLPSLNTTGMYLDFSCNLRHDTYLAWFNRNHWDLDECHILHSLAHDVSINQNRELMPYAKQGLLRLIQTGVLSDKAQTYQKAQTDLYLGRLYYLEGDYKNAHTYYKRAEKLGAKFEPGVDDEYYSKAHQSLHPSLKK